MLRAREPDDLRFHPVIPRAASPSFREWDWDRDSLFSHLSLSLMGEL